MATNWPGAQDSFTTAVDGITVVDAADRNNVQASILALEKFSQPVVNIVGFGAKADNSTNNDAAWTAAVASLSSSGGTIYFPAAVNSYNFASPWSTSGKSFIRVLGASSTRGGGAASASLIRFTGTTGPLVAFTGLSGMELRDIYIEWPAAFTGTVVDMSGSEGACLRGCFFGSNGGGSNAALIAGFDNSNRNLVDNCRFQNAQVAIQGLATSGHFCVAMVIRDCNFSSSSGTIATACISNPHQNWLIYGNVFEMGQGAGNCSIITTPLSSGQGVAYVGNWSGDQGANAVTQLNAGNGWLIAGNYFGGAAATTAISVPNNAVGVSITGNEYQTFSVGVLIGTSVTRLLYAGNIANSVTTEISGTPGAGSATLSSSSNLYGGLTQNGTLQLTGAEQRSTRGPAFVTPFTPDATVAERTEMTLTGAITVNAPTNGANGQRLEFWWLQDATGGRVVTYNAVYKTGGAVAFSTTLSTMTVDIFECARDGTTWRLVSRITGQ